MAGVIQSIQYFCLDAVRLPSKFYAVFDKQMVQGESKKLILANGYKIVAAWYGLQIQKGLVGKTLRSLLEMSRSYLTE